VAKLGWSGIKNGDLLQRAAGQYDVLITMDRGIEFQQQISLLPFGIVLVRARSNRLQHLRPARDSRGNIGIRAGRNPAG
jgi:hypothetical protein